MTQSTDPHAIWPQDHLQPPQPRPLPVDGLAALQAALCPLRPFLRGEHYESELWAEHTEPQAQGRATLCIGPDADYLSVVVRPGEVYVDLPLGDVPHNAPTLAKLVELNTVRAWKMRLDQVLDGQALVALEGRLDTDDLSLLPELVMEALMERTILQATLHALREATHA